jgi:drug/metabolite transporter (DMT)-like permease
MIQAIHSNLLLIIYALTSTAGLVLIKLAGQNGAPISFVDGRLHLNFGPYAIIGIFLYGVSFLLYTYLISKNDLSYIIPISTALIYIGIFFASYFLFHEALTALKITGILLILGGVVLLHLSK